MKVIGFRARPKEIRYAILEYNGTDIVFLNNGENKLKYPQCLTTIFHNSDSISLMK